VRQNPAYTKQALAIFRIACQLLGYALGRLICRSRTSAEVDEIVSMLVDESFHLLLTRLGLTAGRPAFFLARKIWRQGNNMVLRKPHVHAEAFAVTVCFPVRSHSFHIRLLCLAAD